MFRTQEITPHKQPHTRERAFTKRQCFRLKAAFTTEHRGAGGLTHPTLSAIDCRWPARMLSGFFRCIGVRPSTIVFCIFMFLSSSFSLFHGIFAENLPSGAWNTIRRMGRCRFMAFCGEGGERRGQRRYLRDHNSVQSTVLCSPHCFSLRYWGTRKKNMSIKIALKWRHTKTSSQKKNQHSGRHNRVQSHNMRLLKYIHVYCTDPRVHPPPNAPPLK